MHVEGSSLAAGRVCNLCRLLCAGRLGGSAELSPIITQAAFVAPETTMAKHTIPPSITTNIRCAQLQGLDEGTCIEDEGHMCLPIKLVTVGRGYCGRCDMHMQATFKLLEMENGDFARVWRDDIRQQQPLVYQS